MNPVNHALGETLASIERRVLWLATSIIQHANRVRGDVSGVKVGGHQASSASMVSIMTTLWFSFLEAGDRVSVKPHASPVLQAISYLMGRLDRSYLTELRAFKGLQSYPSRTKDPYPVDYSTGSVGLGAVAPIWDALCGRYLSSRFGAETGGRRIALIGDAELDEGACWEAINEPATSTLGEVMWVVDVNRQSLDRVVSGVQQRLYAMFEAAGWHVQSLRYGRLLRGLFKQDGGEALLRRMEAVENPEYQRLLRLPAQELRRTLPGEGEDRARIKRLLDYLEDRELLAAVRDLGGHDHGTLVDSYRRADAENERPSVIFAHTIKGYGLPIEGHPSNHSALLTDEQYEELARQLGADLQDTWADFPHDSPEGEVCAAVGQNLDQNRHEAETPPPAPDELGRTYRGETSTQQEFGRILSELPRVSEEVAERVVTVSPDVASSTNLGGWISRFGAWSPEDRRDWFDDDPETVLRWRELSDGRHIELGIAETNLAGLLGELGSAWSRYGKPLLPIGTIYDCFIGRALEPLSFSLYSGGQFILVATPSGISLSPEGGAHQSVSTPSIGISQPGWISWEPAFGQDLEWILLHALGRLGRPEGVSSYLRLSTRPVDQSLAAVPQDARERELRRQRVLAGGYRLREAAEHGMEPAVTLVGTGAVIGEVLEAARVLREEGGIGADVVCLTSPSLVFRALRARQGLQEGEHDILDYLFPPDRQLPIVTVHDGHPHALSFLSAIRGVPSANLGVTDFGQSGDLASLYEHYGIDTETIVGATLDITGL